MVNYKLLMEVKVLSLVSMKKKNIMPLDNNKFNDVDTILASKSDTLRRAN